MLRRLVRNIYRNNFPKIFRTSKKHEVQYCISCIFITGKSNKFFVTGYRTGLQPFLYALAQKTSA